MLHHLPLVGAGGGQLEVPRVYADDEKWSHGGTEPEHNV